MSCIIGIISKVEAARWTDWQDFRANSRIPSELGIQLELTWLHWWVYYLHYMLFIHLIATVIQTPIVDFQI